MLTKEDNEALTRVGPGTLMGSLLRRYWQPVLYSSELPDRDGTPVRVRLLGEDLVAFRDTAGAVGLLPLHCPHRGASLFYGRNEDNGLRCAYHGWKFDVAGNCLDMPNVPPAKAFTQKVKAKAYPTVERNGLIWTYMGSREQAPPLPCFEAIMLPKDECNIFMVQRECNWLQALE